MEVIMSEEKEVSKINQDNTLKKEKNNQNCNTNNLNCCSYYSWSYFYL